MNFCTTCGNVRVENAKFCINCGKGFDLSVPKTEPSTAKPASIQPTMPTSNKAHEPSHKENILSKKNDKYWIKVFWTTVVVVGVLISSITTVGIGLLPSSGVAVYIIKKIIWK